MKTFASQLGAVGWMERNASPMANAVSLLVVQANMRTRKLQTLRVTYDKSAARDGARYPGDQGWQAVVVKAHTA